MWISIVIGFLLLLIFIEELNNYLCTRLFYGNQKENIPDENKNLKKKLFPFLRKTS